MPPPAEGFASRLFLGPALRTQPDRRLVALVRAGYEAAFEEIVRRYGRPLGRYAASIVGGRSEDVLQDAFAKALPALCRDDAEIDLRPWLFRIVRNTALNDLRDSPPSAEILAEAIAGGRNPAEELECREELADLMVRLQALPEPQRTAIVMRELEGLGHEEIAAALGLTGGGARQAIYRARQTLRDGAGMLIPLPLLQALLAGGGSGVAETAAGAAGVSAAGVGGAAGAGIALKATAATVLVAGAVGAGVAIKDNPPGGNARAAQVRISPSDANQVAAGQTATEQDTSFSRGEEESEGAGGHHGRGSGETGPGDDHGGESELVDDHHGRGGSGETEPGDNRSGHDGSSGRHGGGLGSGGDDRSGSLGHGGGSGSSGSGHGGSSGSGSGHDGSGSEQLSGSGSGSSGSDHDDSSGPSADSHSGGPGPSGEPTFEDNSSGSNSSSDDSSGSDSGSGSSGSGGKGSSTLAEALE